MKQINILKLFSLLSDEPYCLIKQSKIFPEYTVGSDFDIFCYNAISTSEKIVSFLNQYISDSITIEIENSDYKTVIDIIENSSIYLRFDLYKKLPKFKEVNIKESFFSSVIESRKIIKFGDYEVFVPSDIDEAIIRYIEYNEWFAKRPDKIKHVDIITKYIREKKIDQLEFLNKIHYYLKLPDNIDESAKVSKMNILLRPINNNLEKTKLVFNAIRDKGFSKTFSLIVNKIKSK